MYWVILYKGMIKDYDKVLLDRNEWGKSTDSRIR